MKRPVISAVLAVSVLLIPSFFYLQIKTGANDMDAMPDTYQSKQGFQILDREFSLGLISLTEIVIEGDVGSLAVQQSIARLEEEMKKG